MKTNEEQAVYGSVDTNEDNDVMDAEDVEEAKDSFGDSFDFESHGREILKEDRRAYSWRKFLPSLNPVEFVRWLVTGFSKESELEEEEMEDNTIKLARMISLLREYNERFGIPSRGGAREQLWVLTELCCKLYASGTPLWVLKPVMSKAAEGLTGDRKVDFVLFTRTAFIYSPSNITTASFPMERGFDIRMVTLAEKILVRLASFASNARTVHPIKADVAPDLKTLIKAARGQSVAAFNRPERKEKLAKDILNLASEGTGLFYLINQEVHGNGFSSELESNSATISDPASAAIRKFWHVDDEIREIFTRLVTMEAVASLQALKSLPASTEVYPRPVILLFRCISSAGAAGLWFKGSWIDMGITAALSFFVAILEGSQLWKGGKMIFEVVCSFIVGLVSGLICISWQQSTCFQAIAVGAVIDILQGFRVVYSIMEIMSKHTISGGADFLEALLFTGLIAYFLKFGLQTAESIMDEQESTDLFMCTEPISEYWFFFLLPLTALSWAVNFTPNPKDLILMVSHGILSYVVYWAVTSIPDKKLDNVAIFVAAMTVTFSAGFVSRFTGRQALGDTVTGLYVLLPGSYLARGLFQTAGDTNVIDGSLLGSIVVIAVTIGLGGWTGTMLCSPTILGTNGGLLNNFMNKRAIDKRSLSLMKNEERYLSSRGHQRRENKAMLFF